MHRSVLPVLLTASALTLAACGGTDDSGDDGVSVVASFYPAQYLAERVGGDLVEVSTLTSPGVEPHDLELTARQIGELRDADVLVYLEHFQAAVDQAVEQADRDAGTTVDLIGVRYWNPATRTYDATCPSPTADAGAQRLTVRVHAGGRTLQAQVVKRDGRDTP